MSINWQWLLCEKIFHWNFSENFQSVYYTQNMSKIPCSVIRHITLANRIFKGDFVEQFFQDSVTFDKADHTADCMSIYTEYCTMNIWTLNNISNKQLE